MKRFLLIAMIAALVVFSCPASGAEQKASPVPASAKAAAATPTTSPANVAITERLRRLPAPDPRNRLSPAVLSAVKPLKLKTEIGCGVYFSGMFSGGNQDPTAKSRQVFWFNPTATTFPKGAFIEWELQGEPAGCCKGTYGPTPVDFPNSSSLVFFYSGDDLNPAQQQRPCTAWLVRP